MHAVRGKVQPWMHEALEHVLRAGRGDSASWAMRLVILFKAGHPELNDLGEVDCLSISDLRRQRIVSI